MRRHRADGGSSGTTRVPNGSGFHGGNQLLGWSPNPSWEASMVLSTREQYGHNSWSFRFSAAKFGLGLQVLRRDYSLLEIPASRCPWGLTDGPTVSAWGKAFGCSVALYMQRISGVFLRSRHLQRKVLGQKVLGREPARESHCQEASMAWRSHTFALGIQTAELCLSRCSA